MKKISIGNWEKYAFDFLTIFIGVFAAFALQNWNDNRKDQFVETKILTEINNGLKKDLEDIKVNENGHRSGIAATAYFKNLILGQPVKADSFKQHYFDLLRDFISIQNVSGYETLKSKGLEIIKNDSLRSDIISIYEYDYSILRKLEEDYSELQFHDSYFKEFNALIAPNIIFDSSGNVLGISTPLKIAENEKKILLTNLWKIINNRMFILNYYVEVINKINKLQKEIKDELKR